MCEGPHPFIPAEDTAKVTMEYLVSGSRCMNVFHFQKPGGWTPAELETLAIAVHSGWQGDMQSVQSSSALLDKIIATDISVEDGSTFEYTGFTPFAGLEGGNVFPGNVTLAIKFGSTRTGRSYRGRMFFIGMPESYAAGNSIGTDTRDDIVAQCQDLFTEVAATITDAQHVIVSYCQNGAWLTNAVVTPVSSYSADVNLDSMRSRLAGRGI